jgi:plasmid stability protein
MRQPWPYQPKVPSHGCVPVDVGHSPDGKVNAVPDATKITSGPIGYVLHLAIQKYSIEPVQLNVRNLDEGTAERLAAQAEAEGVSLSEWVRQSLDRVAALATPAELLARRTINLESAMPADEFDRYYTQRLNRRSA